MAFVEVSDPELVREAYENGLLYEERCVFGRTPDPIVPAFDWESMGSLLGHLNERYSLTRQRTNYINYKFYLCLED